VTKELRWILAITLMLLTGCQHFARNQSFAEQKVELVDGTYWSPRYYAYLEVSNNIAVRYQWTAAACYAASAGLLPMVITPEQPAGQHKWIKASGKQILLRRLSDGMLVTFNRISKLPASCTSPIVDTAEINLEVLRHTLDQFHHRVDVTAFAFLSMEVELLDTLQFDSELATKLSLFELLSVALDSSDDAHAYLLAPELHRYHTASRFKVDEEHQELARQRLLLALRASALKPRCDEALWHGLIGENNYYIASLRLHSLTADAPYSELGHICLREAFAAIEAELHAIILDSGQAPNMIVDLRFNEGGSLMLANQFANGLRYVAESMATIEQQPIYAHAIPNLSGLYARRVALITEVTASAAEHLANALRIRGFKLAGQHSRGAFSPTAVRTLPNGWVLGLSMYNNDDIKDSNGNNLPSGRGLVPDCILPINDVFDLMPGVDCEDIQLPPTDAGINAIDLVAPKAH
jgi:hypothetical protein